MCGFEEVDRVMNADLLIPQGSRGRKETKVRSEKGGMGAEEGVILLFFWLT